MLSKFRFSKQERILKRSQFVELSKQGEKIKTKYFIAAVKTGAEKNNRIGITASKKVGKAWERNRIKRIVREHFRHRTDNIQKSKDIHVIARKGAALLPNKEMNRELEALFSKIESINAKTRNNNPDKSV